MTVPTLAEGTERTTPAARRRMALALLLVINLFNYIDRQVLAAVEPEIRRELFPESAHDDASEVARRQVHDGPAVVGLPGHLHAGGAAVRLAGGSLLALAARSAWASSSGAWPAAPRAGTGPTTCCWPTGSCYRRAASSASARRPTGRSRPRCSPTSIRSSCAARSCPGSTWRSRSAGHWAMRFGEIMVDSRRSAGAGPSTWWCRRASCSACSASSCRSRPAGRPTACAEQRRRFRKQDLLDAAAHAILRAEHPGHDGHDLRHRRHGLLDAGLPGVSQGRPLRGMGPGPSSGRSRCWPA